MTIGVANLPNQKHRKVAKQGARLNLLIVGQSGLGKRTFVNTLFAAPLLQAQDDAVRSKKDDARIRITEAELVEKGFRLRLNVIEALGFGDFVDNTDSWKPVVEHIEAQYSAYLNHEMRADRSNSDDGRVHVALYFIEPTGHSLKALDVVTMKELGDRVNLIPVIAKADTITPQEMGAFKQRVLAEIEANKINVFRPPLDDDDKETVDRHREIVDAIPFAVIGSETTVVVGTQEVRARKYAWGLAEVENDAHCDFKKLRSLLLRSHLLDLIVSTEDEHYERFRDRKLLEGGLTDGMTPEQLRRDLELSTKKKEQSINKRLSDEVREQEKKFDIKNAQLRSEEEALKLEVQKLQSDVAALRAAVSELQVVVSPVSKKR